MIHINHLHVAYGERILFDDAEMTVERGKLTAVCGPSGVGKTTLLNIIGLLSGFHDYTYTFDEKVLDMNNEQMKADMRKQSIAYVFQQHNLHDDLSILDNIKLYCYISGHKFDKNHVEKVLNMMGLTMDTDTKVSVLSGGEYQRLSLVCALMKDPHVIIADEITSALDHENSEYIISLLKKIAQTGRMVILATHDKAVLSKCDVLYTVSHQKIMKESNCSELTETSGYKQSLNEKNDTGDLNMKHFYRWYSKFSLGKRKWEKYMFILMPSFIIFLSLFFIGIKDGMIQRFHDSLNEYGMNEVYITGNSKVRESEIEVLKGIEGVSDVAVLSTLSFDSMLINDEPVQFTQTVTAVPYFSFQNDYLDEEKTSGAYVSYYLVERYHMKKGDSLKIKEGEINIDIEIGGILKQDLQLVQGMSSLFVIYIPQAIFPNTDTTNAVVHLENFEAFKHIADDIDKALPNHQAYLAQSDYLTQMASMETYSRFLETFITALLILTVVFLSVSQFFAVKNRKYEICVLRANGLSKKETAHVILRIFADDMIKTGLLVFLMLIATKLTVILIGSEIFVLTGFMVIAYLLMLISIYVIPVTLTLWIMLRINIEKMMRS